MRGYGTVDNVQTSISSLWQVPSVAYFCSLFRLYFELLDFDIEELEEALLADGPLLQDLIVRLLRGCFNGQQNEITSSNYQMYLRRLFRIKCEEDPTKINPFDGDIAFHSLPLRTKVEILHDLCDFRLDNEDVPELLKTLEASCLRVEPLGQDSGGSNYFYFFGTRLYREDYSTTNHAQPGKRRGRKGNKSQAQLVVTKWQVACSTEEDWQVLTDKFKNCKSPHERSLHRTLRDNFLPELPRLFAEKEKLQRKRMLEHLGRNGRSCEEDSGLLKTISSVAYNGFSNGVTSVGGGKPTNRISLPTPRNLLGGESVCGRCSDYDDDNWSSEQEEEEDDNSDFKITSEMDDEQELRKRREEQEKADRLLAEAIEREERKARLHLRERRGGGAFSSPSNTGSRNSSSVSTERPQSMSKTSTVSKQTVAAAVSKKGSKASPVKASPVKKKSKGGSGSKSKRKGHSDKKNSGNSGRMTNNSMSVSLSPAADNDQSDEWKKEPKDEDDDDDSNSSPPPISYSDEEDFERDKSLIFKRFETGKLEFEKSPSKKGSSKKKKIIPRSPSPDEPTLGGKKKSQKSRPKQKIIMQINEDDDDDDEDEEEAEAGENLETPVPGHVENEEFCEEEEEADYESIVARTLHTTTSDGSKGKVKVKSDKKEKPSKGKEKVKDKARSSSSDGKPQGSVDKKKEKGGSSSGSKKRKKEKSSISGGKIGKSTKKSNKSESSSSGLIGGSTISLGGGTSKTKMKSSVLFSQSDEDVQIGMHKVIEAIKNHRDAWPFVNPVDEDYAPNYYKIISNPMDLQTMEDKLDNHEYSSLDEFKADFERIVENCRTYNGPVSEYTEMVETVEGAFNKLIQRYIVPDESDEEISIEYANTNSERKRPIHHSNSSESSVPKKKTKKSKVGSERMSSPTPIKKEHKKENEPAATSPKLHPTSKKKPKSDPIPATSVKSSSAPTTAVTDSTKEQKDKEKLERKKKKAQLMRHHSRDSEAIENLASVAAETLKDINKWLDDTPKPTENYGAAASSSSATPSKSKSSKVAEPSVGSSGSGSKEKKLLSSSGGQKRSLELSSSKKVRSTKFNMDEDDEYNIDRDLSPPPPKASKTDENAKVGKKGKHSGGDKKEGIGRGKEKARKHHHKHHHHHHHAKKEETLGALVSKSSKVTEKKSSGSSASSVASITTSTSSLSTAQQKKAKGKKKGEGGSVKKAKKRPAGSGTGTSFLNTLKNSPAFKRMNQMSRVSKNSSTGEPHNKSQAGQGNSQGPSSAFDALLSNLGVTSGTSGTGNGGVDGASATEKKKCLLVNDLPVNKEGISLGSVLLSTDAIKLKTMDEDERLSDEDEFDRKIRTEELSKAEKEEKVEDEKQEGEPEEEKDEDFDGNRKLELQQKGFNREKCMPNLSAWIKAFGGPAKGGGNNSGAAGGTSSLSTSSPLVSPVKKTDPDGFKTKFRVMGRGVGEAEGGNKSHQTTTKGSHQQHPPSPHHHPSVIKSAALASPSPSSLPAGPSWNPVTNLPHSSPPSNPLLNPSKQAALERTSQTVGEDLSSPPASSSHPAKKYRNRKMSSSSLSSQSESGSPLCVTTSGHEGGSTAIGNFPPVVNPPRWVDDHPWGPVSQSQSPSASSHVSSQSPAGPNSPFSPSVNSPPPTTPQTPPRHHPIRPPGFYQDMSQHSSPDKVNDSSPTTPPTPNSGNGSHNASTGTSSSRRTREGRYVANTVSAISKQSSNLPSPATSPSAGVPPESLSPNSPKVVNMSSANSSSGPIDHRSSVNGPNTPAHQQSSRGTPTSVLHSTSSPYSTHHFASSAGSHQLPDPAHSHVHSLSHLGQPPQAHAGSSNQYHESSSSRFYPPTVPHAHQQSVASTSSASLSSSSASYSGGGDASGHQNLAHAHSRQPSQTHLSHPSYPSSPYASNPRNINIAPNVYNNPVDPSMNRYYKAAMAAASVGGSASELSLSMGSNPPSASSSSTTTSSKRHSRSNTSANAGSPSPHPETQIPRSASVNPAAAVAAALEAGKLAPNGFHWPHNLASLTQIVNSIPGAYRHYAAQQAESNAYPVTTSAGSGGGGQKSSSQPHHHHQSDNSIQSHHHHQEVSHGSSSSSSKKQKSGGTSEAKSRSQSNTSAKSSSSVVPGSAFNFSLAPDSLALYSKEMSDAATSSIYSSPPMAHFPHHSSFSAAAGARTQQESNSYPVTATPPISPYPFIPGTPYQAHQSGQPFAAHSQSSRGLDPYQQLPFLLSHPSGYPAPYAHPHSSLGFNRPGWI